MTDDIDDGEESRHRRPPKNTRFKKGASGNPSGRPKKVSNFKSDLAAELQEKIILTENGKERRVTKQRAFIKTLTAAAIKKDIRAVSALLACMRYFRVGTEETPTDTVDTDDLEILQNYIERERQRNAPNEPSSLRSKKGK
jgi:Family of unknown function (DUF5681)